MRAPDPVIVGAMPAESSIATRIERQYHSRERGREIARLAGAQHGVIARSQLNELGLRDGGIDSMVQRSRLHPVRPGVYAVGHDAISSEGCWMAAVLAAGADAVLSHRSAAALWSILPFPRSPIEVTAPTQHRLPSAIVHRRRLLMDEVTVRDGIRVTGVSRTLFDLAAVVPRESVQRAINQAEVMRLTDPLSLDELVLRYRGRRGVAIVRSILEQGRIGLELTRSELEARFLAFLDRTLLPRPMTNTAVQVGGRSIECDCVWRSHRLVVELDGRAFHDTADAYERDRRRDRGLHAAGWRVIRVTWQQLTEEPEILAFDLRRLLTGEAAAGRDFNRLSY
jgi:very-short-patch-repair endonuclease